ncbi:metallophosphoesterase [Clostridium cagae]|uniref:metallophosphoesterase n=1 Tax=Clostridium TaxID=1485 RepID=UPI0005084E40|nr:MULTISPECIES: metallophosphoesterase [unclassified Clostridium]KFX58119.1 serine/threonine protein phosphatase [Clostridium botulinum]MBY6778859.1 metallophosphoesterase family protein [Clostridium botulinum]MBY6852038.1 metallophosphoesterase family protein [Clostridium botulinum]MBY7006594.1 metallophosphoesterase family protein [Clostridium botulinum]NFF22117.1 serine/threonine protein phosphatase [Clostridium botulinum]
MNSKFIKRISKDSPVLEFDKNSKIVLISDMHRGDGGNADSLRPNKNIYKAALGYYLKDDFNLIEIGDGDELWKNKNCIDIAYNYDDIFKILNKFNANKRLYLLYGNHDMVKAKPNFIPKQEKLLAQIGYNFGKELVKLYNNIQFHEGLVLRYTPMNKDILVFHGHQVDFMNCELWKISRFLVRYVWRILEGFAGFKAPVSPANNYGKGSKIDEILERTARKEKRMLICGHTHHDVFPEAGKGLYFNDGCCVFPSTITTIEIVNGEIYLIKWSVEVDEKNSLYIKRSIIGGPEKIGKYLDYAKRL